jgi:hypothetical protein
MKRARFAAFLAVAAMLGSTNTIAPSSNSAA